MAEDAWDRARRRDHPGGRRVRRQLPQRVAPDAGQHARTCRAAAARTAAAGAGGLAPEEGAVGSGTGMSCLGFKGGIGSSSRLTPSGHAVGVLVMTNFGEQNRLTIDGVPVGRMLPPPTTRQWWPPRRTRGRASRSSPPTPRSTPPRRARAWRGEPDSGLARTGSSPPRQRRDLHGRRDRTPGAAQDGSERPRSADRQRAEPVLRAVVDATEEAVLNSLLAAPTVVGRDGNYSRGLPADRVAELLSAAGRI